MLFYFHKNIIKVLFVSSFLARGVFAQVTLDNGFGNNGIVITPSPLSAEIMAIAVQTDSKIVAAGYTSSLGVNNFQLARYHSSGLLDNGFGNNGIVNTSISSQDFPYSMALQLDGKIILVGNSNNHCVMVRYNTSGTLDNNFGVGGIVTHTFGSADVMSSVAIQSDGKIVTGAYAGNQFIVLRYNIDGTLDNSFGAGGIALTTIEALSNIHSIFIQADGKIISAGLTTDNTNSKFALVRYNSDGTLDTNFGVNGKVITDIDPLANDACRSIHLQVDGKIVAAGYSGNKCALVKYNADGSLDFSFGISGIVVTSGLPVTKNLVLQSDGKIIIHASVNIPGFGYDFSLTRFNTDGTPDNSFGIAGNIILDIGTVADYCQYLLIQPDQKIIAAGSSHTSSLTQSKFTLARFTTDVTTLNEYSVLYSIKPFPNPVANTLFISSEQSTLGGENSEIEIFNTLCQSILKTSFSNSIDVSKFQSGFYYLKITTSDNKIFNSKFIKE